MVLIYKQILRFTRDGYFEWNLELWVTYIVVHAEAKPWQKTQYSTPSVRFLMLNIIYCLRKKITKRQKKPKEEKNKHFFICKAKRIYKRHKNRLITFSEKWSNYKKKPTDNKVASDAILITRDVPSTKSS